jgi:hypothetical protein
VELEGLHTRAVGVEEEHTTEAGELVALVIEASNALVDLRRTRRWWALSWSARERRMPQTPVSRTRRWSIAIPVVPGHPACRFSLFFLLGIDRYIHILKTCVPSISVFLGPQPRFLVAQGFGMGAYPK